MQQLRSLIRKVEKLTGSSAGSPYTLEVTPRVHLAGTLGDEPVTSDYAPALKLQLDPLKLRPDAGSSSAGDDASAADQLAAAFNPKRDGSVSASTTRPTR